MGGRRGTAVLLTACLWLAASDLHARPLLSQDDATTRANLELLGRILPDKPDPEGAIEALRFIALGGEYPTDAPFRGTRKGVVASFQCTAGEPRTLASFSEVGVSAVPLECEAESRAEQRNGVINLVDAVSRIPRLIFFERLEYRASPKSLQLRFRLLVPFYPTPVGVEGERLVGSLIQVVEALKAQMFGLEHVLSRLLQVGDGPLTSLEIQGRWTLEGSDGYRFVESPSWRAAGAGLGTSGGFRRAALVERNPAVTLLDPVVRRRAEGPCTRVEIEGRWQLSPPSSGGVVAPEAEAPAPAQTEPADPSAVEPAPFFVSQLGGRQLLLADEPCPSDRDPADRQLVVPPQSGKGDLTLRLRDVDLADVFRALSEVTGQGFLVDQNVLGRATVDFSRVTLDDALRALERSAGLSVSRPSRIRRVSVGRAARGWAPPPGPIWPSSSRPTRPVSFGVKRWRLDDLLSLLKDISALSVEAPAELPERVTVGVVDEPWPLLYESILGALGLRMESSDQNAIRVRRGDDPVSPLALGSGNNNRFYPRGLRVEDAEVQDVRFAGIAAGSGKWLAAFYGPIAEGLYLKEAGFRFRNAVLKSVDAGQVTVGWSTNLLDPDGVVLRLPLPLRPAAGPDRDVSSERAREAASPAAAFYERAASGELGVPIDSRSRLSFHRILVQYLLDLGGEEETARRAVRDGVAAAAALDLSDPELAQRAALIAEQASHLNEPIEALWPKLSALGPAFEGGGLDAALEGGWAMEVLLRVARERNDLVLAEQIARRNLAVLLARHGGDRAETVASLRLLADILKDAGKPSQAVGLWDRVIGILEPEYAKDPPAKGVEYAQALDAAGRLRSEAGDWDAALERYAGAVAARAAALGAGHPDVLASGLFKDAIEWTEPGAHTAALLRLRNALAAETDPAAAAWYPKLWEAEWRDIADLASLARVQKRIAGDLDRLRGSAPPTPPADIIEQGEAYLRVSAPVEPLAVSRETTWITEPLRPDGTPDYPAWLTRRYAAGVTSENNAAIVLLQLRMIGSKWDVAPLEKELKARLDEHGMVPGIGHLPADFAAVFAEQHRRALLGPWHDVDAPLITAWLRVNEASLERAEQVVRSRPRFWLPFPDDMGMDTAIPSRLGTGAIANAFRARTLRRAAVEDSDGARRDLILGLRFAALVDQGPRLIDRLIGLGVRRIAAEPVVALANPPPTRRVAAAALLGELREVPPQTSLDDVLDVSERLVFLGGYLDLYRAARRSPQAWQERLAAVLGSFEPSYEALGQKPPPPNLRRIPAWAIDWNELFRRINECWLKPDCEAGFAAAAKELESPAFELLLEQARTEPGARRRIARAFLTLQTTASLGNARVAWNEQEAIARTGLISAAAGLWHVDHGRYPVSAAALASGAASAGFDPASDHAGYAFRYAVSSDGRRFAYTATPLRPGATGNRRFCADSSGRLASTTDRAASMLADGLCAPSATTLVARTVAP